MPLEHLRQTLAEGPPARRGQARLPGTRRFEARDPSDVGACASRRSTAPPRLMANPRAPHPVSPWDASRRAPAADPDATGNNISRNKCQEGPETIFARRSGRRCNCQPLWLSSRAARRADPGSNSPRKRANLDSSVSRSVASRLSLRSARMTSQTILPAAELAAQNPKRDTGPASRPATALFPAEPGWARAPSSDMARMIA